jgi:hypothetical protein
MLIPTQQATVQILDSILNTYNCKNIKYHVSKARSSGLMSTDKGWVRKHRAGNTEVHFPIYNLNYRCNVRKSNNQTTTMSSHKHNIYVVQFTIYQNPTKYTYLASDKLLYILH